MVVHQPHVPSSHSVVMGAILALGSARPSGPSFSLGESHVAWPPEDNLMVLTRLYRTKTPS